MSGDLFESYRLVWTTPDCPQLTAIDENSRSFLGYDPAEERLVEFRVANDEVADCSPAQRARIERRAKRWSQVRHAGVAAALGWGDWDGRLTVVSEFVDGERLLDYAHRIGALPPELALGVVLQVADIAALAGEHDWLAPLELNDFAVDYDERSCLRVRLFNVGLFRDSPLAPQLEDSMPATDSAALITRGGEVAARHWFRRLVVLLQRLCSGDAPGDADTFDCLVDEQMPDDGTLVTFFDRLRRPSAEGDGSTEGASASPSPVAQLMALLRRGVLAASGVEEPTAAKCYGCRPRSRWAPIGPLPARIYGERSDSDDDSVDADEGGAFDRWLQSDATQRWWQPPHRLSGQLCESHLGVAVGTPVQVQLFPPASYAPGCDQNALLSSMQDPRLRNEASLVRTLAVNWDDELTYTLEEPVGGFRLCDWAARHEDLPLAEVAALMLDLSRTLRRLEVLESEGARQNWPVDPWSVWVHFEGTDGGGPSQSPAVLAKKARGEWPAYQLKIRLGPSWERLTLAVSGVWSAIRGDFSVEAKRLMGDAQTVDDFESVIDFATLTVWLAQYETLAAALRRGESTAAGVSAVVSGNPLVNWMRDWLAVLLGDGFAGRQIVLHELSEWQAECAA